jgi:hypothetical protein
VPVPTEPPLASNSSSDNSSSSSAGDSSLSEGGIFTEDVPLPAPLPCEFVNSPAEVVFGADIRSTINKRARQIHRFDVSHMQLHSK